MYPMRSQYYQSLPQYFYLERVRQAFQRKQRDSDVKSMIEEGITRGYFDKDDYIQHPDLKADTWIPLVYSAMLTADYPLCVGTLLDSGASLCMEPDSDNIEPIFFSCHHIWLETVLSSGCKRIYPRAVISRCIQVKLRTGNWEHLSILNERCLIDMKKEVRSGVDLIYYALKNMKEYLMYCYNIRNTGPDFDKTGETERTVSRFSVLVGKLLEWGHPPSQDAIKLCIRFYLFEVLAILDVPTELRRTLVFHEDIDPVVVAVYRPLLNDYRYSKTKELLN